MPLALIALLGLLSISLNAQETTSDKPTELEQNRTAPITLATNIYSAFSSGFPAQQIAQNLSPDLKCIFNNIGRDYQVQVLPWRRAYQDIKSHRIDGVFTVIPMTQMESHAVLSAPLTLENWYWFWRQDTIAPGSWRKGFKLGSILASQQATWLEEAGYDVDVSANDLPQLIKLLQTKRIDVILADREHFFQAAHELQINPADFQSRFFRYVPLSVYFNERFLAKNPGFLAQFNAEIVTCTTTSFILSAYEREQLTLLLQHKIDGWKSVPNIEAIMKARNASSIKFTQGEIQQQDKQWVASAAENNFSYAESKIDQGLSAHLKEIKRQAEGIITEIILTDARGLNLAISDLTSDYWQGDEDKYSHALSKPAHSLVFSDIHYDESTKHFQLHLSVPLYAADKTVFLGVLIFGINIEKALSHQK